MEGDKMGYILYLENTKDVLKRTPEGGFSSKQERECHAETGYEARTHRPSLSPNS